MNCFSVTFMHLHIPGMIYGEVLSIRVICKVLQPNRLYIGVSNMAVKF